MSDGRTRLAGGPAYSPKSLTLALDRPVQPVLGIAHRRRVTQ